MGIRIKSGLFFFAVGSLLIIQLPGLCDEKPSQVTPPPVKENTKVQQPPSPEDVLIVQLTNDADRAKFDDLLQDVHGTVIKTLDFGPKLQFLVIQTEPGKADEVEKRLSKDKDVALVQRNRTYHANNDQSSPSVGQ